MKRRILALLLSLSLILGGCGSKPLDVQPSTATQEPIAEVKEDIKPVEEDTPKELYTRVYGKTATGSNGMVAAGDKSAAEVGVQILEQGGNACDAAVATAFAMGLTEPFSNGLGGSGFMLYYDAKTGETTSVNYYLECPAAMNYFTAYNGDSHEAQAGEGGKIAVVPGTVAGMLKANELFGTKTISEILAPTIKLAEEGYEVSGFSGLQYLNSFNTMRLYPETAKVFLDDDLPYMEGDIHVNKDYAKTLRLIEEKGFDGFYKGENAQNFVAAVRDAGGIITMQDLANYTVEVYDAYKTTYRGYGIASTSPASAGPVVLEALNIAENFDVSQYDHNSAEYYHFWSQVFKCAIGDFNSAIEDPMYGDQSRALGMVTKEYAAKRAKEINMDGGIPASYLPGSPYVYAKYNDQEGNTTHLSVIDKDGNMCAMTNTLGDFFGSYVTAYNGGYMIECTRSITSDYRAEAGKQAKSPMCPCFVFDPDGQPLLATGTPGSNRIMATNTLIISNVIDYGMSLEEAVNAQRMFQQSGALEIEDYKNVDPAIITQLKKWGNSVTAFLANDSHFGGVHAIIRDVETGELTGVADPRRSGLAVGLE